MLELLVVVELLVICTWIGFVAYGAWFFTSAKKRRRDQAEVQESFSGLYKSHAQGILSGVSIPEQAGKPIPEPPKRPERVRARARSSYSFVNDTTNDSYSFVYGLATGIGATFLATFFILWIMVFYASQLSVEISYEKMISDFIYPMLFILSTGIVLLTTGVVRRARASDFVEY